MTAKTRDACRAAGRTSAAALWLLLAFGVACAFAQAGALPQPPLSIEVKARAIDAFDPREASRRRVGELEFRGGLELTSSHRGFGGLSGLRMLAGGERLVAVSDKGDWLRARIIYDGLRPAGLAEAEMAPLLGPDGRPLAARGWYDAEALTGDDGALYVAFERVNRVARFDFARQGFLARGQPIATPPSLAKLPHNKGLECLAMVPKPMPGAGTLIAIAERALDAAGQIRGFLIGGRAPGEFSLARSDDFDVSDCAILPSGDLAVLERRFSWATGVAIRIRRVPLPALRPGALVDGKALLFADMAYQIDNMEGLGVHRGKDGEVVLTLISDDNFSPLQRTLLLQFTLLGE